MPGLFGAIWLALQGVASIKDSIERQEALLKPSYISSETGQPIYYDNHMRVHGRNGEKLEPRYLKAPDGSLRIQMVGKRSGVVYEDDWAKKMQRWEEDDKRELESEKKYGKLAYNKHHIMFDRPVTTEIATGKVITCLYKGTDPDTKKPVYKKWYFRPECQGKYDYNRTADGDYGIDITEEEYEKLNIICKTCTGLPSDGQVLNKLWGETCFH